MQIIEIKNNLVKMSYDTAQENLILSGFLVIKDENQLQGVSSGLSFIAQIMHLEATSKGNFAIAKLVFNFDSTGVVTNYNGSIPSVGSEIEPIDPQSILDVLSVKNPVVLGELAQQNTVLKLDRGIFEEKLLVCSEHEENNKLLIENMHAQLAYAGKKLLVIDLQGGLDFSQNKIVAGEDFKLPLNYETINFIYERGLDDANAESKALIQDVFLEVQNYVRTLEDKFLPFELFKGVVDEQYQELGLVELVLLKNKLLKYQEAGLFAQEKSEFLSLEYSLKNQQTTILDLSKMDEKIQREMISYVYSKVGDGVYVVVNINNKNSDKKLLKQIFMTKTAYSTVICPYSYKYLTELKQVSRNMFLFAPIQQQNDFASYNIFLNKLNSGEFVVCGTSTNHIPFLVELSDIPQNTFEIQPQEVYEPVEEEIVEEVEETWAPTTEDLLDEQIRKDVDKFYTQPKSPEEVEIVGEDEVPESEEFSEEEIKEEAFVEEALTEDDLDFLDELNIVENNFTKPQEEIVEEIPLEPQIEEQEVEAEEIIEAESQQAPLSQFQSFEQAMAQNAPAEDSEILPASVASTPIVPIYPAEVESEEGSFGATTESFEQGDNVFHAKYGKGIVEKLINYGSKTLCSINFDNVGRRLLDPTLAGLKKV